MRYLHFQHLLCLRATARKSDARNLYTLIRILPVLRWLVLLLHHMDSTHFLIWIAADTTKRETRHFVLIPVVMSLFHLLFISHLGQLIIWIYVFYFIINHIFIIFIFIQVASSCAYELLHINVIITLFSEIVQIIYVINDFKLVPIGTRRLLFWWHQRWPRRVARCWFQKLVLKSREFAVLALMDFLLILLHSNFRE